MRFYHLKTQLSIIYRYMRRKKNRFKPLKMRLFPCFHDYFLNILIKLLIW